MLFLPSRIGKVLLRNRVIFPPMTTRLADAEGFVTDSTIAYFAARARGGVGLVTVEMAAPEKAGRHRRRELGLYDDRFLPGLTRLVDAIHAAGARASIQIGHGGGHTRADICGETPIAPSAIPHDVFEVTHERVVPEEMSLARIEQTIAAHVAAARRAEAAGFDCIEIHGAHGYLISQFLCSAENQRTDQYGGSLENRARFGIEILRRVKAALAKAAVIFRFDAEDFYPGGMMFDQARQLARWAAEAGADALHVSAGHYRSLPNAQIMIPPMAFPEGVFLDYAARIKREVSIPVIAVGRLGNPQIAIRAIEEGKADFVAIGRGMLADPDWVEKAREGRAIRRCLSCNTCVDEMRGGAQIGCLVNPAAGHESEFAGIPSIKGERIAVIGAGPAGLSYAALLAASNTVTIFERKAYPGGALMLAGKAPRFQEVAARETPLHVYAREMELAAREAGAVIQYEFDAIRRKIELAPFDRLVIVKVARQLPDVTFPMIGGCSLAEGWCPLPNVHLLGRKPYAEVARYMAAADVLLMPWNNGEWIQNCNPVKLKEYLATGRPVVSTPYPELAPYVQYVTQANTAEGFAAAIRQAIANPGDGAERRAFVAGHTWDAKADGLLRELAGLGIVVAPAGIPAPRMSGRPMEA